MIEIVLIWLLVSLILMYLDIKILRWGGVTPSELTEKQWFRLVVSNLIIPVGVVAAIKGFNEIAKDKIMFTLTKERYFKISGDVVITTMIGALVLIISILFILVAAA